MSECQKHIFQVKQHKIASRKRQTYKNWSDNVKILHSMARAKHYSDTRPRTLYVSHPYSHKPRLYCYDWLVRNVTYSSLATITPKHEVLANLGTEGGILLEYEWTKTSRP